MFLSAADFLKFTSQPGATDLVPITDLSATKSNPIEFKRKPLDLFNGIEIIH